MKIIITGGTGFIGIHLTRLLVKEGNQVYCLVRNNESAEIAKSLNALPIWGDVCDKKSIEALPPRDIVFHLAGSMDAHKSTKNLYELNEGGTNNILTACANSGGGRFVYLSSAAVITTGSSLHNVDESYLPANEPIGAYAQSKKTQKNLFSTFKGQELNLL